LLNEQILTPSFIFVFNTTQRNLNRGSILNRLEGELSEHIFHDRLIQNIDLASSKKNSLITEDENSNAAMIRMQQEEMKKLEDAERDKRRKEIEEESRKKKEIEEHAQKERQKEELRKIVVTRLPSEPEGKYKY
jgi:hypothetical protein